MAHQITQFEKKILDFLKGHYNQQLEVGDRSKTETKRLSKAKNDITSKITNSIQGFALLSEMIRISNISTEKIDRAHGPDEKKYVREQYTDLNPDIVEYALSFDLAGEEHVLQYFKALQREIASDIFGPEMIKQLLDSIFVFHPQGIVRQDIGGHITFSNAKDIADARYKDSHKKYYRDMASILVESGIGEIKKNLHPDKDKALIDNLDLTVNMIRRLDYDVDEIKQS